MESEPPIDPAEGVTDRLGDREFQPTLHFKRTHPVVFNQQSEGNLGATSGYLTHSLRPSRIKFIDEAEHSEQIWLWHTIFAHPYNLAFTQADGERFQSRMDEECPSFSTQR